MTKQVVSQYVFKNNKRAKCFEELWAHYDHQDELKGRIADCVQKSEYPQKLHKIAKRLPTSIEPDQILEISQALGKKRVRLFHETRRVYSNQGKLDIQKMIRIAQFLRHSKSANSFSKIAQATNGAFRLEEIQEILSLCEDNALYFPEVYQHFGSKPQLAKEIAQCLGTAFPFERTFFKNMSEVLAKTHKPEEVMEIFNLCRGDMFPNGLCHFVDIYKSCGSDPKLAKRIAECIHKSSDKENYQVIALAMKGKQTPEKILETQNLCKKNCKHFPEAIKLFPGNEQSIARIAKCLGESPSGKAYCQIAKVLIKQKIPPEQVLEIQKRCGDHGEYFPEIFLAYGSDFQLIDSITKCLTKCVSGNSYKTIVEVLGDQLTPEEILSIDQRGGRHSIFCHTVYVTLGSNIQLINEIICCLLKSPNSWTYWRLTEILETLKYSPKKILDIQKRLKKTDVDHFEHALRCIGINDQLTERVAICIGKSPSGYDYSRIAAFQIGITLTPEEILEIQELCGSESWSFPRIYQNFQQESNFQVNLDSIRNIAKCIGFYGREIYEIYCKMATALNHSLSVNQILCLYLEGGQGLVKALKDSGFFEKKPAGTEQVFQILTDPKFKARYYKALFTCTTEDLFECCFRENDLNWRQLPTEWLRYAAIQWFKSHAKLSKIQDQIAYIISQADDVTFTISFIDNIQLDNLENELIKEFGTLPKQKYNLFNLFLEKLTEKTEEGNFRLDRNVWDCFIRSFGLEETLRFIDSASHDPKLADICDRFDYTEVKIRQGGGHDANFHLLPDMLTKGLSNRQYDQSIFSEDTDHELVAQYRQKSQFEKRSNIDELLPKHFTAKVPEYLDLASGPYPFRCWRTLYFPYSKGFECFKFKKIKEDEQEFAREFRMAKFFRTHREEFELSGQIACQPIGLYQVKQIP